MEPHRDLTEKRGAAIMLVESSYEHESSSSLNVATSLDSMPRVLHYVQYGRPLTYSHLRAQMAVSSFCELLQM